MKFREHGRQTPSVELIDDDRGALIAHLRKISGGPFPPINESTVTIESMGSWGLVLIAGYGVIGFVEWKTSTADGE